MQGAGYVARPPAGWSPASRARRAGHSFLNGGPLGSLVLVPLGCGGGARQPGLSHCLFASATETDEHRTVLTDKTHPGSPRQLFFIQTQWSMSLIMLLKS